MKEKFAVCTGLTDTADVQITTRLPGNDLKSSSCNESSLEMSEIFLIGGTVTSKSEVMFFYSEHLDTPHIDR